MSAYLDNINTVILTEDFLLKKENFNTHVLEYKQTELHSHDFFEIVYVLNGSVEHWCNDKKTILQVGDTILLRPKQDTHTYRPLENQSFTHRDILISEELTRKICDFLSPSLFELLYAQPNPIKLQLSVEQLLFFESEFSKIRYNDNQTVVCPQLHLALVTHFFALVCEHLAHSNNDKYSWLDKLLNLLNTIQNFKTPLPQLLQRDFHYNPSYMCKVFKKKMGMTMTYYFNTCKINYAKTLLLSTDYTVLSISEIVGFNNISHFNHEFKKRFQVSPSDYRKHKNPDGE